MEEPELMYLMPTTSTMSYDDDYDVYLDKFQALVDYKNMQIITINSIKI